MKTAGAVTVALCSVLAGIYLSWRERQALFVCSQICLIMKYVRERICTDLSPTDVVMRSIPSQLELKDACRVGLYEALSEQIRCLSGGERAAFSSFCSAIGHGSAATQAGVFDAAISRYEAFLQKRSGSGAANSRIYVAVSVFIGACAVIIFI